MKYLLAAASLGTVLGFIPRNPLTLVQNQQAIVNQSVGRYTRPRAQVLASTSSSSTTISLPYSFTETIEFYQYDASSSSLESLNGITMKIDIDAEENLERIDLSIDYNGQTISLQEVIDWDEDVVYLYYPDYNYC